MVSVCIPCFLCCCFSFFDIFPTILLIECILIHIQFIKIYAHGHFVEHKKSVMVTSFDFMGDTFI